MIFHPAARFPDLHSRVKFNPASPLFTMHLENERPAHRVPGKMLQLSFPERPESTPFVALLLHSWVFDVPLHGCTPFPA